MRNVPVLALLGLSAAFAAASASAQDDLLNAAMSKPATADIMEALTAGARPAGALASDAAATEPKAALLNSNPTEATAALVGPGAPVRMLGSHEGPSGTDRLVATPEIMEAMNAGALNNAALEGGSARLMSAAPDADSREPVAASLPAMKISPHGMDALGATKKLGR